MKNNKLKTKKIILYIILIIELLTIFIFSNQPGKKSENTSDSFASSIIDKVTNITNKDITETKKKNVIIKTRFIVRKAAHFTIYFVLGITIYLLLETYNIKRIIILSIIICLIFGSIDEVHQIFIPGRTARIYDCIIDTIGGTCGIYLLFIIEKIRQKRFILKES